MIVSLAFWFFSAMEKNREQRNHNTTSHQANQEQTNHTMSHRVI
ncbi:hypothetical protein [Lacinutrix undariae]